MGRDELRNRANWQQFSLSLSVEAERNFFSVMSVLLHESEYKILARPREFAHIYENWPLDRSSEDQIYKPEKRYQHGFIPDYLIENTSSHKKIYIEVKRQDGWVEGLPRSAGRGNAHERLCKYFSPGLTRIMKKASKVEESLPFWIVFVGNITRDPCRVREITCWFGQYQENFFFWRNNEPKELWDHFIEKISPLLD
ncbi:MAG: MunI family type II restriction endonuclease [Gammaproteobacteria bacterium]|nr:MunI family type II restriction endonuclease [Gammaproteobacteria bacterium]MDE0251627.1 MunI family type II restriction endonuclease [Gammaproteobacteria bacterium]MDE0403363.1 MunI family type II restriction endonuclease [Gammaproteobacteria bacterium]